MSDWKRTSAGTHIWTVNGKVRAEIVKTGSYWAAVIYLPTVSSEGVQRTWNTLKESKLMAEILYRVAERERAQRVEVTEANDDAERQTAHGLGLKVSEYREEQERKRQARETFASWAIATANKPAAVLTFG